MNREKVVAKTIGKMHKGKAKEKDLLNFLGNCLSGTSLDTNLGKNKTNIHLTIVNNGEPDDFVTRGQYFNGDVYINPDLISAVIKGEDFLEKNSFVSLVETYGHEVTHLVQAIKGMEKDYKDKAYACDIEKLNKTCNCFGINLSNEGSEKLWYYLYLDREHEVEARSGGADFLIEFLKNLQSNQYLKKDDLEKIKGYYQISLKNLENYDDTYIKSAKPVLSEFMARIKECPFEEIFKNVSGKMKYVDAVDAVRLWSGFQEPKDICQCYLNTLGKESHTDNGTFNFQDFFVDKILSKDFPNEVREKMVNEMLRVFKTNKLEPRYYQESIKHFLSVDQIFDLYERSFNDNMETLNTPLFSEIRTKSEYGERIGKIILDNIEKKAPITDQEAEFLYDELFTVTFISGNKMPSNMKGKLSTYLEEVREKLKTSNKTEDKEQSKVEHR